MRNGTMDWKRAHDAPSKLTKKERRRLADLWSREGELTIEEWREMKAIERRIRD